MSATKIKFKQKGDEMTQGTPAQKGIFQEIKERLMHMCFEFNKYRYYPVVFSCFLIIVSYLQIYAQLMDKHFIPRVDEEWGPFSFVGTMLDLFRITPYFEDNNSNSSPLTFVYIMLALIVLYLVSFYYMHHAIDIKRLYFILPIELASLYGACLFWVLIGPVSEVYVMVYFCEENGKVLLLPSTICWSTEHFIHLAILTVGLFLHVFTSYIISFFFNESRPYAASNEDDALARLDISSEVFFTTFRVVISLLGRWLVEKDLSWVLLILHLVYAATFAYNYYRFVPYYHSLVSTLYGGCIANHLWQIVNIIAFNLLGGDVHNDPDRKYKGVAIVISIGMIIIFVGAMSFRKQLIRHRLIDLHHAKITSDEELDLYIQSLLVLFDKQSINPTDELLLRGVISRHRVECLDPECPLIKYEHDKLYHPLTEKESGEDKSDVKEKIILLSMINSILHERQRRLGDQASACLHLVYSNFLFKEMGNIHMAIVEVMKAQRASPSFQQEVSIYQLLRSIEKYLVEKYRKKGGKETSNFDKKKEQNEGRGVIQGAADFWDVTIVIKFENWLVQLVKMVEKCAGEHIEFWSHLESLMPDLTELNRIGLNILQSTREISNAWKKISKINPNHPKALNIYGYYLRDIKNDPELGQEYIERAISINLHKSVADDVNNEFELMFAEDTAIIVINGSPEFLGKITKTNAGVFKLFGYNPYEIYGNDVSILMPGLFAHHHAKFMQRYFDTGRQYLIQNERTLFALHRNNYLFCISIVIKPVPSLTNAIPHYIGLMRQIQKDFDFIITDRNGKIDAISMGIYHTYNITANFIKENQVYIHLICPDLAEPIHYSHNKLRLRFDRIHGKNKLNFVIPRDFTTLAHLFSQTAKDPLDLNQPVEDDDMPFKLSEASHFFNLTYKIYKQKYKGKELEIGKRNIVKECFDYTKFDVRTQAICDISEMLFAGNMLHLKVFQIYRARVIKRKNSYEDYNIGDDATARPPQRHPSQSGRKNSQFDPNSKRVDSSQNPNTAKRSVSGLHIDLDPEPSPGNSQKQESEGGKGMDWSPRYRGSIPGSSEMISIPQDTSMMESKERVTEEKKQSMETSISSEKRLLKLHNIGESQSNSTPDLKGISASGASEGVSNVEEDRKRNLKDARKSGDEPPVIKIIDTRQMEVAKKLLVRRKTMVDQDKKGEKPENESTEEKEEPLERQDSQGLKKKEEKKFDADTGSVATTTHNLMRIISSLQGALHEMYSPPAIAQLQMLACSFFFVFITLSITCYVMAGQVYNNLEHHLDLIISSRDRRSSLVNVAGSTRLLKLMKCSTICLNTTKMALDTNLAINYTFNGEKMNYSNWVVNNLESYSDKLKSSQDALSKSQNEYKSSMKSLINPSEIYVTKISLPGSNNEKTLLDCFGSINGVVTHALRVKSTILDSPTTWDSLAEESVTYILDNAFNSILSSLENSMEAMLKEVHVTASGSETMMLIFLLVTTGVLLLIIGIIMPVVVKIRKNKQELLCLFLEIPIRRAKGQLDKCHLFCRMIHGEAEAERQDMDDEERTNMNMEKKFNDETDMLLDEENKLSNTAPEHGKKRRKFKPYDAEIISLIIESIIVIALLISYFFYDYFRANWFTNTITHMTNEVGIIVTRITSNELYLWIGIELLATNGTGLVMGNIVENYMDSYNKKLLSEQETFLKLHSENSPYNDNNYKDLFDHMIYSDVCSLLSSINVSVCQSYMDGILQKGLNSANIAFWDALQEVANDFKRSNSRSVDVQSSLLIDQRVIKNHWLLYYYFTRSYDTLQIGLQTSIQNIFDMEKLLLMIIFIIYLLILILIYILFTKVFVENIKDSLWVTKSLLTILPPEIILQVGKIRNFVLSTSKSMIYGLKAE